MQNVADLREHIKQLIASGNEGDYWDFKQKHHANSPDLVKDIISLANLTKHQGSRFIIFGIEDNGTVCGIPENEGRTQADIINTLNGAGFAGNNYPSIHLIKLRLDEANVEVLEIKDLPEKPYYLQKELKKNGTRLNPGTIYSRVRDSNTPSDQVASANEIEAMWRERFGLDKPPLQRLRSYLKRPEEWTEVDENEWYYTDFPEFTIIKTTEETTEILSGDSWVRSQLNPTAFVRPFSLNYHQTRLHRAECVYYDEMRYLIPAPDTQYLDSEDSEQTPRYFYHFTQGTLNFDLLCFFTRKTPQELIDNWIPSPRSPQKPPIIVFQSELERLEFVDELETNPVTIKDLHIQCRHSLEGVEMDYDFNVIAHCLAVIERYESWRARR